MADKKAESEARKTRQALKQLKASYDMYENTKKETRKKLANAVDENGVRQFDDDYIEDKIETIQNMEDDVLEQYYSLGGKKEDLEKPLVVEKAKDNRSIIEMVKKNKQAQKENEKNKVESVNVVDYIPKQNSFDTSVAFDVIPLPSKGQTYKSKKDRIAVSYLTANDENMFVSPNLYRDGLLVDYLLREKIQDKEIDPQELTDGDRDAIILWLRATGYGNEFPITVTDDRSGKNFDTVVDLSTINFKEFNLISDENGLFDFELPVSKMKVKFKFLSHRENEELRKMDELEKENIVKFKLDTLNRELSLLVDNDSKLPAESKNKIYELSKEIDKWRESLSSDDSNYFTHSLTNKLFKSIVSIEGNDDRDYIYNFIMKMNVKDSLSLRKYILDNEPGLDFKFTVERPESLGGGSLTTFPPLDQFIFLQIA